ncbi:MAG: sigma-70 family RNA polymerase sigma factor [Dehalococcoidia bacterium]
MPEKEPDRSRLEEALLTLYEESYDRVARYLFARIGDQQEAEDLASEAFLRALENLDSYKDRGLPMAAWVFKIAHNLYVDYIRKSKKGYLVDLDDVTISASTNVEESAEQNDRNEKLSEALEHLTPGQREVIVLRFFSGLKSRECAEILGKKHSAIREMQSAAMRTLRQVLDREHDNEQ